MKQLLSALFLLLGYTLFAQQPVKVATPVQFQNVKTFKSLSPSDTARISLTTLYKDSLTIGGDATLSNPLKVNFPNVVASSILEIRTLPPQINSLNTTFKLKNSGRIPSTSDWTWVPGDRTTHDDSAMNVRDASNTGIFKRNIQNNYIDVRWFGAQGDYVTDDWYAITKAINYILEHADCPKRLYMPRGQYMISKPLFIYNWDGTNYQFVKFEIFGDGDAKIGLTNSGTSIKCMPGMGNNFALGIQLAKGVVIRDIEFIGLYTASNLFTRAQIARNSFIAWAQPGISHKRTAPHAGLILDPVTSKVPEDGGYSSLSSMYRGTPGNYNGSTGVKIVNCRFTQFDVDIAIGINGFTLNGEDIFVEGCDFGYSRVAYATGESQTVGNLLRNFKVWSPVHTVIDGLNYGQGQGVPPNVFGGNIAGGNVGVYQLINVGSTTASFTCHNLRAESMFKIGTVTPPNFAQSYAASFIDCEIHPWDPGQWSELPTPDFLIMGKAKFINSNIEYIEPGNQRLKLNNKWLDVSFDGGTLSFPMVSRPGNNREEQPTKFSAITTWQDQHSLDRQSNRKGVNTLFPSLLQQTQLGTETIIKFNEQGTVDWTFEWRQSAPDAIRYLGTATIVNNITTGTCSIAVPSAWLKYLLPGDALISDSSMRWQLADRNPDYNAINPVDYPLVIWRDFAPTLGVITAITGNYVTMKGVGVNVPNGTLPNVNVYVQWIRRHNNPIAATIKSGTATLTNIERTEIDVNIDHMPYVGQRLEHVGIPDGAYVTGYTDSTIVISDVATGNYPHAQIINGSPIITATSAFDPVTAVTNGHINLFEGKWIEKRQYYLGDAYKYREYNINRATFTKANRAVGGYTPSWRHPISVSGVVYTDNELTDFSGSLSVRGNIIVAGSTSVSGTLLVNHIKATGSTPTIKLGVGAGNGATAIVEHGGDLAFGISMTTGSSPGVAGSIVATVLFATQFSDTFAPIVTWSAIGSTGGLTSTAGFYFIPTTTSIEIRCATVLKPKTTYKMNIMTAGY